MPTERVELVDAAGEHGVDAAGARRPPPPRATASSPATVGALSVSDSSRAARAIAVAAAIVFITVLGNSSGERPAGPRAR